MPRKKRLYRLNCCHHVMLRGNNGELIFHDDHDRIRLCLSIQRASEIKDFRVHAFCFMENHIHLILEPRSFPIGNCVHAFSFRYAQFFNKKYDRNGYLFQGRFKSILVEPGMYLQRLIRYIHLNPVRAGISKNPEDHRWSSHRAYMGEEDYTWLEQEHILNCFCNTDREARKALRKYIVEKRDDGDLDLEVIREANAHGIFGSDEYVETMKTMSLKESQNFSNPVTLDQLFEKVCQLFRLPKNLLISKTRSRNLTKAREALSFLIRRQPYLYFTDCSKIMGRDSSYFSKMASRAERDDILQNKLREILEEI